ncbi:kinase-like domain-containing protein [Cristinia sonorae]|uniref:Kinase-like domain-containing protein n=1 Tax=Cristinia sonorae TaxID=1940300 RepID=A0A8K0UU91_9AGAR|nr:kinase-like domain-containing protein [Cristinia sonorae]
MDPTTLAPYVEDVEDSSSVVIDGRINYTVGRLLGGGYSSAVFEATCQRGRLHGRVVALKKDASDGDTSLYAQLHQSLHHPSIISLHSFFSAPSASYHVLEYCSCDTLHACLQSRNPPLLTETETRCVLRNVASALIYLQRDYQTFISLFASPVQRQHWVPAVVLAISQHLRFSPVYHTASR